MNSNVVDPTTGVGVNATPGLQNQIQLLGILRNLFQLASVPSVGLVGTDYSANTSFCINAAANDTLSIYVIVSGSTKTVDLKADSFGYYNFATFTLLN